MRAARLESHMTAMEQRLTIHIVDSDSRSRAEQARTAFALGHHAEVYSDLAELLARMPPDGIVLLRERAIDAPLAELFDRLGRQGIWVPLIVCDEEPKVEFVVTAIKGGALDYLELPLEVGRLARSLARVIDEADAHGRARQHLAEARQRIAQLSRREREVLELLALGNSNKLIARDLSISPRTVEIHRANMMGKLRAGHAAEAVRLWLESGLESTVPELPRETELDTVRPVSLYSALGPVARDRLLGAVRDGERESKGEARSKKLG